MFWSSLLSWLGSFLTGPLLGKLIEAYRLKLAAGNTAESIEAGLAVRELALQAKELELQTQYRIAELGRWYEPDKLMGFGLAAYYLKLVVWDKVFGLGTTEPLAGWVEVSSNLIISFYFAKRGFENVARIIRR